MKLGLPKTTSAVKDLIEDGYDFEVNVIVGGGLFFSLPTVERDALPKVVDFKKAGAELEEIAYFFAYQIAYGNEVIAIDKEGKQYSLNTREKPKIADDFRIKKIEDKYREKASMFKKQRDHLEAMEDSVGEKTKIL